MGKCFQVSFFTELFQRHRELTAEIWPHLQNDLLCKFVKNLARKLKNFFGMRKNFFGRKTSFSDFIADADYDTLEDAVYATKEILEFPSQIL